MCGQLASVGLSCCLSCLFHFVFYFLNILMVFGFVVPQVGANNLQYVVLLCCTISAKTQ